MGADGDGGPETSVQINKGDDILFRFADVFLERIKSGHKLSM